MSTRRMRPEQVVKGEGGNGIWDKSGQGKFEELWEEEDEAAYQLLEGDYEGAVRGPGQGTATTPPISQSSFCLLQSLSFMLEDGEAVVTDTQDDDVQPTCEGIRRRVPIADVEEVEQRWAGEGGGIFDVLGRTKELLEGDYEGGGGGEDDNALLYWSSVAKLKS